MKTNIHKEMGLLEVCQTTNGVLNKTLGEVLRAEFEDWFGGEQGGRHIQTDHGPRDHLAPYQHQFLLEYLVLVHH